MSVHPGEIRAAVFREYHLDCSNFETCKNSTLTEIFIAHTKRQAERIFRQHGWVEVKQQDSWYCPDCKES